MAEKILYIENPDRIADIFGSFDSHAALIEKELGVLLINRDVEIKIIGDEENISSCVEVLNYLERLASLSGTISEQNVQYAVSMVKSGDGDKLKGFDADTVCISAKGRAVKPKTMGQKAYVQAIRDHIITIGVGPAGTGKTFLAVAAATAALRNKEISRIILTRPAVEAGERLGFLPGDLQSKIDPYLRPLYDALYELIGAEGFQRHLERNSIEVAPLAYMRGRTLDDSFIILDEAQNTTPEQMKMFLTRLGFNSKVVVTGDITQIDLPHGTKSGLIGALDILRDIEGIAIERLGAKDVVRHSLVTKIIEAYEKAARPEEKENAKKDIPTKYKRKGS